MKNFLQDAAIRLDRRDRLDHAERVIRPFVLAVIPILVLALPIGAEAVEWTGTDSLRRATSAPVSASNAALEGDPDETGGPQIAGCATAGIAGELSLCRLEIVEAQAGELGPDLPPYGDGGFWVESYVGGDLDTTVEIGSCEGQCIASPLPTESNVHCRATAFKPVRIEHHAADGVTPWRVWVPSACGCGVGLDIGWFTMIPLSGPLDDLVAGILGEQGTGGDALRGALANLRDLDGASTESLIRDIVEDIIPVFALVDAPEPIVQANAGQIPMTPDLKAALEQWVWNHASSSIDASLEEAQVSSESRGVVVNRLRQTFPRLFVP